MKKVNVFLFVVSLLSFSNCSSQNENSKAKPNIHKIDITASSVKLVEFNSKESVNTPYVTELLDNSGRVIELRFYNSRDELTYAGSGFLGGPIIKYEYQENKIIETFFESETTLAHDFCCSEVPYRHVYHLDKENRIKDIDFLYKMDFEWDKESLKEAEKNLKLYQEFESYDTGLNQVFGYTFSHAKMNGVNPIK